MGIIGIISDNIGLFIAVLWLLNCLVAKLLVIPMLAKHVRRTHDVEAVVSEISYYVTVICVVIASVEALAITHSLIPTGMLIGIMIAMSVACLVLSLIIRDEIVMTDAAEHELYYRVL